MTIPSAPRHSTAHRAGFFLAICAILASVNTTGPAAGQETAVPAAVPAAPAEKAPRLRLGPQPVVGGDVLRGDPASGKIPLWNDGDVPLEVRRVTAKLPGIRLEFDPLVAPGGQGEIRWSVDTLLHAGGVRFWIAVETSDPATPVTTVALDLAVRTTLYAVPLGARFQTVQHEVDGLIVNTVWTTDHDDFQLLGAETDRPDLRASVREATESERNPKGVGRQWRVEIVLPKDAAIGPLVSAVTVRTNHPREPVLYLPVTGMVRPIYAATPPVMIYDPPVKVDRPMRSEIDLRNFATAGLPLGPVESPQPWLEASLETITEGRRYRLVLLLKPEAPKGPLALTVRVKTPHPNLPWIEVPVRGRIE